MQAAAPLFESRVVLDGNQTSSGNATVLHKFESRVVLDGNQTKDWRVNQCGEFESRVVLDGNQTPGRCSCLAQNV